MSLISIITFMVVGCLPVTQPEFTVPIPNLPDCWCSCTPANVPAEETEHEEYMDKLKSDIQRELLLDTEKLSSTTRKKTSATDNRMSAVGVGSVGVVTLSVVVLTVACMDLTSVRFLRQLFKGRNP